jgi:hypothetical protein
MKPHDIAALLRAYARQLRQPRADAQAIAADMSRRAAALEPRPNGVVDAIVVGRRTVLVQRPRRTFGL